MSEFSHIRYGGSGSPQQVYDGVAWQDLQRRNSDDLAPHPKLAATWSQAEHIDRHDPARVLREVEAKRRILDVFAMPIRSEMVTALADGVVRLLALPYADRPGYQQEWAP